MLVLKAEGRKARGRGVLEWVFIHRSRWVLARRREIAVAVGTKRGRRGGESSLFIGHGEGSVDPLQGTTLDMCALQFG